MNNDKKINEAIESTTGHSCPNCCACGTEPEIISKTESVLFY
jgi:hypothetical protein